MTERKYSVELPKRYTTFCGSLEDGQPIMLSSDIGEYVETEDVEAMRDKYEEKIAELNKALSVLRDNYEYWKSRCEDREQKGTK